MASAGEIRAGRAYIEMGLNDAPLRAGMDRAKASLNTFVQGLSSLGAAIGFGSITSQLKGFGDAFASSGRELYLLSQQTGASVEELSGLKKGLRETGVEFDSAAVGIRHMQRFLNELQTSGRDSNDTLEQLGLTMADLAGLTPVQQFEKIGAAIDRLPGAVGRAGSAMAIFGRSGTELLPGFNGLAARRANAGPVMTAEEARRAFELANAHMAMDKAWESIHKTIGGQISPLLKTVYDTIGGIYKGVEVWVKNNESLVQGLATVVGVGASAAAVLTGVAGAGFIASQAFGAIGSAIGGIKMIAMATFSPIGLAVAAIAATAYYFRDSLGSIGQVFSSFVDAVSAGWSGVFDALSAGDLRLAWEVALAAMNAQWVSWSNSLGDTFGITFNDLWAGLKTGWVELGAFMRSAWAITSAFISDSWRSLTSTITQLGQQSATGWMIAWIRMQALVGLMTSEAADRAVNDLLRAQSDAEIEASAEVGQLGDQNGGALNRELAQIEAERVRALDEINRRRQEANAEDRNGQADADLQAALQRAAAARAAVERARRDAIPPALNGLDDFVRGSGGARGTFSAAAVAGLAGPSNPVVGAVNRLGGLIGEGNRVLVEIRDDHAVFT